MSLNVEGEERRQRKRKRFVRGEKSQKWERQLKLHVLTLARVTWTNKPTLSTLVTKFRTFVDTPKQ